MFLNKTQIELFNKNIHTKQLDINIARFNEPERDFINSNL
jgi:hypothetical protein